MGLLFSKGASPTDPHDPTANKSFGVRFQEAFRKFNKVSTSNGHHKRRPQNSATGGGHSGLFPATTVHLFDFNGAKSKSNHSNGFGGGGGRKHYGGLGGFGGSRSKGSNGGGGAGERGGAWGTL